MDQRTTFIIEVEEEPVGLALNHGDGVLFHAVHPGVQRLHGAEFADTVEASKAAKAAFLLAA